MKPILNWAGGKRWFISNYSNLLPSSFNRYIEPFLGSAVVFFWLNPVSSILSDLNSDLIETYLAIKENPQAVLKNLLVHKRLHTANYYYQLRATSARKPATKAAKFIYLNRTCFNGIYRVNSKGKFNVPKGTKNTVIYPKDDFQAISAVLQRARLYAQDFEKTILMAKKGDFVYSDPPYTVRHNNNNFVRYNEPIFNWKDQERLASTLTSAANNGAYVMLSNANSECIKELYSESMWSHIVLHRNSVLASDTKNRHETSELLITNYLNENEARRSQDL